MEGKTLSGGNSTYHLQVIVKMRKKPVDRMQLLIGLEDNIS